MLARNTWILMSLGVVAWLLFLAVYIVHPAAIAAPAPETAITLTSTPPPTLVPSPAPVVSTSPAAIPQTAYTEAVRCQGAAACVIRGPVFAACAADGTGCAPACYMVNQLSVAPNGGTFTMLCRNGYAPPATVTGDLAAYCGDTALADCRMLPGLVFQSWAPATR